jgi:hypothetical protein
MKNYWVSDQYIDVVIEAHNPEEALESFKRTYGYRERNYEFREVDFEVLEKSGHTFFYVMADGVGVTIND